MITSYREILIVFLMAHILSVFYFQSESMARKKDKCFKYLVIHSIVYGLVTLIIVKLICTNIENNYLLIIIFSHFLVDALKYILKKNNFIRENQKIFL